ncbi:MAG: hypothetical protein ACLFWF_05525 [Alphaproteobacteria bacterium]
MSGGESRDLAAAIRALNFEDSRPLVVCDADEVLVRFVAGLERFMDGEGLWLDLQSFALTGNIRERESGRALEQGEVSALLERFYAGWTDRLEPVPGAASALGKLSACCQIVILSNLPASARAVREAWLARHGMAYPVIANRGLKGSAFRALAARCGRPAFFLDDLPHNIADAARSVPEGVLIHFVADPRLARLLPPARECHLRTGDWEEARTFMEERLGP